MATSRNKKIQLYRNSNIYSTREAALTILDEELKESLQDGEIVLVSYETENGVKSLLATARREENAAVASITVIDVEGTGEAIEGAVADLDATVGGTQVPEGKHVNVQVVQEDGLLTGLTVTEDDIASAALLGTPEDGADKETAFGKIAKAGSDSAALIDGLNVSDVAEAKKFVKAVSEANGLISVERGSLTSANESVTLGDTADGGVDLAVNIDGVTIKQNATTKKLYVDTTSMVQYVGENAIEIGAENNGEKKVMLKIKTNDGVLSQDSNGLASTIALKSVTPSSTIVKEEYELQGINGAKLGEDTIKVYKDSSIIEIYLGTENDTIDTGTGVINKLSGDKQFLNYAYVDNAGVYHMEHINVSNFLVEAEFADGLEVDNHIVKAKIDSSSEKVNVAYDASGNATSTADVLSVGSNGIKVNNVQNAIDAKIGTLDSTVGGTTIETGSHVNVQVVQEDGKLISLIVTESGIAGEGEVLTSITAGNGIEINVVDNNTQSVTAVAVTNDPIVEVTQDGIATKEDAVFDCGFYSVSEPNP